jgi:cell division protease FtsH
VEKHTKFSLWYFIVAIVFFLLLHSYLANPPAPEISYRQFREFVARGWVERVAIGQDRIRGELKAPLDSLAASLSEELPPEWSHFRGRAFRVVRVEDDKLIEELEQARVDYRGVRENNWLRDLFVIWILPLLVLILIWGFIFRRISPTQNVMSFGKARVKLYAENPAKKKITFADVAGIDEAVEEVKEIVDFLKNPEKYQRLGGKLPKGVLLVGPPGTGKTLLAKAVAGEAGVPFFSLTGSDFVEMFVGVGAARVRDLFAQAKQKAPCIVFIDEMDAIGRRRGRGAMLGGHDELENTLNQLLSEMDGFDSSVGVVIMAATNRPDVLDPALLRPGRFDRQIVVDKPDLKGREAIFRLHTRKLPLGEDVDLHLLAAQTPGFAGAEIANVCNEAALLASRKGKNRVEMPDFQEAIERVIAGLEKKNKLINENERRVVAYHEAGHATVGWFLTYADPVHKVSIVPRGISALGYTLQAPLEDRYLLTQEEILDKITALLGGRAAEELIFNTVSTGAANDLEKVTQMARNMVTMYGMSEKVGHLNYVRNGEDTFLGRAPQLREYSEATARLIDEETKRIVEECYQRALTLLKEHRQQLEALATNLLDKEVIEREELEQILGPSPVQSRTESR